MRIPAIEAVFDDPLMGGGSYGVLSLADIHDAYPNDGSDAAGAGEIGAWLAERGYGFLPQFLDSDRRDLVFVYRRDTPIAHSIELIRSLCDGAMSPSRGTGKAVLLKAALDAALGRASLGE